MGREAGGSRVLPPCHHVVLIREERVLAGFEVCWLNAGLFILVKNGSGCETRQMLHASAEQLPGGRCHAWNGASRLATALQRLVDEQVTALVYAPHEAGIDLLADFAEPLAGAALARFLILPSDSLASLSRWSDAAQAALSGWSGCSTAQVEQLSEWLTEALEYFVRLVKNRKSINSMSFLAARHSFWDAGPTRD
ncbi:cytochrome P450 [Thermogemmatispora tikiterensis]|uniref:cytochrome P450 n=1 Tax=Thermogemmatispora tikiterensis TaxID=1825093 RepID=UPI0021D51CC9|nr:cytochrome P450 [Thermogemmatispora tikiterensis]